ncbi:hypothetical protein E4191_18320 (plasmid) [Paracoccus liaowanqingii]|uniref:DUF3618 domain-containing protein n=1 Tax=Paracoccus liaowanqingii TaxID=2560053 RepID=A0A4Y5ST15_9RHOB|nr:hypothetical protein [Paracoccus liaowanqingii]QDA36083.1 hypothetical protein E4191_18320 [Paracoccus liaowanqingii]
MPDDMKKDDAKSRGSEGAGGTNKEDTKAKTNALEKSAEKAKADAQSTGTKVKKEVGTVVEEARKAATHVKEQAGQAAGDVAGKARDEIHGAIDEQKNAGVERLQSIAGAIGRAGDELGKEVPFVGEALDRAARELDDLAEAVRDREPRELLDVAQDFARRQPVLFAGALGLVGFAAVRFFRASPQSSGKSYTSSSGSDRANTTFVPEGAPKPSGAASGDPGGVDPAAPGFGAVNKETKGAT